MPNAMVQAAAEARADDQRERILRIAASLFATKGYMAVGVAELGSEVGLGRGALYYHIGSKEELLFDIVSRYITELVSAGEVIVAKPIGSHEKVRTLSRHMLEIVSLNRAEMTVCFRESECLTGERQKKAASLHSRYQALWTQVFAEGRAAGFFRALPPVAVKGLLGMYFHSFLWLKPGGSNSAAQVADVFSDIVLRALSLDVSAEPIKKGANGDEPPRRVGGSEPSPSSRSPARARAPRKSSASRRAKQ